MDRLFEWKPAVYRLLGNPVPKLLKPLAGEFNAALKIAEDAGEKSQQWMKAAYSWREKAERWEKEAKRLRVALAVLKTAAKE